MIIFEDLHVYGKQEAKQRLSDLIATRVAVHDWQNRDLGNRMERIQLDDDIDFLLGVIQDMQLKLDADEDVIQRLA